MALDLLTNITVAIKCQVASSHACAREFAVLLALKAHPSEYVSGMLDYYTKCGPSQMILYTVQPLASSTLFHIFRSSPQGIAEQHARVYLRDAAHGLRHLNMLQIVHGDASLLNMLLIHSGRVQVADFGAAHSAIGTLLKEEDEITTQYVRAPESLLGEEVLASAMDVWSWGVMLWCLATGSCSWMQEQQESRQKHLVLLTEVIGKISDNDENPLRSFSSWTRFSNEIIARPASVGCSEDGSTISGWSVEASAMLRSTMTWYPQRRSAWSAIIQSDWLSERGGDAIEATVPGDTLQSSSSTSALEAGVISAESTANQTNALGAEGASEKSTANQTHALETGVTSADSTNNPTHALAANEPVVKPLAAAPSSSPVEAKEDVSASVSPASIPASIPFSMPDSPYCACHGNCGSPIHKRNANMRYREVDVSRQVCEIMLPPGSKFRYCQRCRCEQEDCGSLRHYSIQRWCKKHAVTLTNSQYAVPSGVHDVHKK